MHRREAAGSLVHQRGDQVEPAPPARARGLMPGSARSTTCFRRSARNGGAGALIDRSTAIASLQKVLGDYYPTTASRLQGFPGTKANSLIHDRFRRRRHDDVRDALGTTSSLYGGCMGAALTRVQPARRRSHGDPHGVRRSRAVAARFRAEPERFGWDPGNAMPEPIVTGGSRATRR